METKMETTTMGHRFGVKCRVQALGSEGLGFGGLGF